MQEKESNPPRDCVRALGDAKQRLLSSVLEDIIATPAGLRNMSSVIKGIEDTSIIPQDEPTRDRKFLFLLSQVSTNKSFGTSVYYALRVINELNYAAWDLRKNPSKSIEISMGKMIFTGIKDAESEVRAEITDEEMLQGAQLLTHALGVDGPLQESECIHSDEYTEFFEKRPTDLDLCITALYVRAKTTQVDAQPETPILVTLVVKK